MSLIVHTHCLSRRSPKFRPSADTCTFAVGAPRSAHALSRSKLQRGFTAIELMVVVAIVAVLAALAMPNFVPMIESWRVTQSVEDLRSTLYLARSEALKRGGNIGIEKSPDSSTCKLATQNEQWGCGWFVFVDKNNDQRWNTGEEILQITAAPKELAIERTPKEAAINFNRFGIASSNQTSAFVLAPQRVGASSPGTKSLCFSPAGRISVLKSTTSCDQI